MMTHAIAKLKVHGHSVVVTTAFKQKYKAMGGMGTTTIGQHMRYGIYKSWLRGALPQQQVRQPNLGSVKLEWK